MFNRFERKNEILLDLPLQLIFNSVICATSITGIVGTALWGQMTRQPGFLDIRQIRIMQHFLVPYQPSGLSIHVTS